MHDFPALAPTIDTGNPFRILGEDGQGIEAEKSGKEDEPGFEVSLFEDKNCFGVPDQIDTEVTRDDRTGTNLEDAGTVAKILSDEVFGKRSVKASIDPRKSIEIPIADIIQRTLQKTKTNSAKKKARKNRIKEGKARMKTAQINVVPEIDDTVKDEVPEVPEPVGVRKRALKKQKHWIGNA